MSEKNADDIITQILVLLQQKFKHLDEFHTNTNQLADALNRNDNVSTQIMFQLREDSMNAIDKIDETLYETIDTLSSSLRLEINRQLSMEEYVSDSRIYDDKNLNKIGELYKRNKRLVERIITVDRVINQKISGSESFYK